MLPLQHAALWRSLSIVLLCVVLAAALSPAFWFDSRVAALVWFENVDKWIHAVTFVVLSVWFAGLFERHAYWRVAAGLLLFGFLIEGCQLLVSYRMADWIDIAANAAGILIGLTAAAAGLGGWGFWIEDWYAGRKQH